MCTEFSESPQQEDVSLFANSLIDCAVVTRFRGILLERTCLANTKGGILDPIERKLDGCYFPGDQQQQKKTQKWLRMLLCCGLLHHSVIDGEVGGENKKRS